MKICLPRIDDWHCHLRDGDMLEITMKDLASAHVRSVVVMPNLLPPIISGAMASSYDNNIRSAWNRAAPDRDCPDLKMLLFLHSSMAEPMDESMFDVLFEAPKHVNVFGIKWYPCGVTTNSDGGVYGAEYLKFTRLFELMEKRGKSLHIHAEQPGTNPFFAEEEFMPIIHELATRHPRLRIVIEHVSTKAAVDTIITLREQGCSISGTITPQHLLFTVDDVVLPAGAERLRNPENNSTHALRNPLDIRDPLLFCKPLLKDATDRDALIKCLLNARETNAFYLGSDSAPHPDAAKFISKDQDIQVPAGCYSMPLMLEAVVFAVGRAVDEGKANAEDAQSILQAFCCENGRAFHQLLACPVSENCPMRTIEYRKGNTSSAESGNGVKAFRDSFPGVSRV